MTKKTTNRQTEKAMYMSIISTALCVVMLIGMTFAWFTSTVESSQNIIKTANFDVDVLWSDDISTIYATSQSALDSTKWHDLDKNSTITDNNSQPFDELSFLPGQEVVRYIAMYNKSAFDVKFDVSLRAITDNTTESDALLNALEIYTVVPVTANNPVTSAAMSKQGTAAELQKPGDALTQVSSSVVAGITEANTEKVTVMAISVKLPESYSNPVSETVNFYIKVIASQWNVEHEEVSANYSTTDGAVIRAPQATVTVPAGAVTVDNEPITNGDTLTLTVEPGEADSNLVVDTGDGTTTYEVNLTNQNNVKVKSDEGIIVELDIGIVDLHGFYHNATPMNPVASVNAIANNGDYFYDVVSGIITFMTDSFSPFTAKYEFAGGLGTKESPYLVENVEQMQHISLYDWYGIAQNYYYDGNTWSDSCAYANANAKVSYHGKPTYFKIKDGVREIDCSNWTPVMLYGSFDGNGVTFKNLNKNLFQEAYAYDPINHEYAECLIENFNVEAQISYSGAASAIAHSAGPIIRFKNINISGKIEGNYVGSFFTFGAGQFESDSSANPTIAGNYTFENCVSSATLLCNSIGEGGAGGFIHHPYGAAGTTITIKDSKYTGTMYVFNGRNHKYVSAFDATTVVFDYSSGFESGVYTVIDQSKSNSANFDYPEPYYISVAGEKHGNLENCNPIEINAVSNAKYAIATLFIAPNPGALLYPAITEELEPADGKFVTVNVRKYYITWGAATSNITENSFEIGGNGSYSGINGSYIIINQYSEEGTLLSSDMYTVSGKMGS